MDGFERALQKFTEERLPELELEYLNVESIRQEFLRKFPKNSIATLELDDYVIGKYNKANEYRQTFCYYLEFKLQRLGSIAGSFASVKYGVYYSAPKSQYVAHERWDPNLNPERAFEKIRKAIVELLEAGEENNLDAISDIRLAH